MQGYNAPGPYCFHVMKEIEAKKQWSILQIQAKSSHENQGDFQKNFVFENGKLVSINSNLIDDRMGEILYREGILDLDTFSQAASKVSQKKKFGQALMELGQFGKRDLWHFLEIQSKEIFLSLGLYSSVSISHLPYVKKHLFQLSLPFTDLLEEAEKKSLFYRSFYEYLNTNSVIKPLITLKELNEKSLKLNDFLKDLLEIIETHNQFVDILNASKLSEEYTTQGIIKLYEKGFLNLHFQSDYFQYSELKKFKDIIEICHFLNKGIQNFWEGSKLSIPWETLFEEASLTLGEGIHLNSFEEDLLRNARFHQWNSADISLKCQEFYQYILFEMVNYGVSRDQIQALAQRIVFP